jgi:hypothetical protein
MITTEDVAKLLDVVIGDEVEADIDLFQVVSKDYAKLKQIMFDYSDLAKEV